jgi:hypothetical protein
LQLILSSKKIRENIERVQPSKIAVAYVGIGWDRYISITAIREIVVSPTLGTNPKAIEAIVDLLGFDKVHFLDKMHAKIYIGANSAVLGSCNLSDNGFSDAGLIEAAVFLSAMDSVKKLELQFDQYRSLAIQQYPTKIDKIKRLKWLLEQQNKAVFRGDFIESPEAAPLSEYSSKLDRIHVVWYSGGDYKYNEAACVAHNPELFVDNASIHDYFGAELQFLESDDIRVGDWLLTWRANDCGSPRKNGDISWMRVHCVVPSGVDDPHSSYSKLVGEAKKLETGRPPFLLDERTKNLIRKALMADEFAVLRSNSDDWKTSLKHSAALIESIKRK